MLGSIITLFSFLVLKIRKPGKEKYRNISGSQLLHLVAFLHIQNRVMRRSLKKVKLTESDRYLLTKLARKLSPILVRRYLIVVKAETLPAWHRRLGSFFHAVRSEWGKRVCRKKTGAPLKFPQIYRILKRNAAAHPEWGIWKHLFELRKVELEIPFSTCARYLRRVPEYRPRLLKLRALWRKFLKEKKEKIAAMDFLQFRLFNFMSVYVFFIIEHERRTILHWNMTFHPTEDWVCRQLTAAFELDEEYEYLIFDRDAIFSVKVRNRIKQLGLKEKRIAPRSPWQNGIAERWVQTVKNELFYRRAFWNVRNSRRLLKEYVHFYNSIRPHRYLDGDSPLGRPVLRKSGPDARLAKVSHCDGLHAHYEWRCDVA